MQRGAKNKACEERVYFGRPTGNPEMRKRKKRARGKVWEISEGRGGGKM